MYDCQQVHGCCNYKVITKLLSDCWLWVLHFGSSCSQVWANRYTSLSYIQLSKSHVKSLHCCTYANQDTNKLSTSGCSPNFFCKKKTLSSRVIQQLNVAFNLRESLHTLHQTVSLSSWIAPTMSKSDKVPLLTTNWVASTLCSVWEISIVHFSNSSRSSYTCCWCYIRTCSL